MQRCFVQFPLNLFHQVHTNGMHYFQEDGLSKLLQAYTATHILANHPFILLLIIITLLFLPFLCYHFCMYIYAYSVTGYLADSPL